MIPSSSRWRTAGPLVALLVLAPLALTGCGGGSSGGGDDSGGGGGQVATDDPLAGATSEKQADDTGTASTLDSVIVGVDIVYSQYGGKLPKAVDLAAELQGQVPQLTFVAAGDDPDGQISTPNQVAVFREGPNRAVMCLQSTTKKVFCGEWKPGASRTGSGTSVDSAEADMS